jgi:hypothetical protein
VETGKPLKPGNRQRHIRSHCEQLETVENQGFQGLTFFILFNLSLFFTF